MGAKRRIGKSWRKLVRQGADVREAKGDSDV